MAVRCHGRACHGIVGDSEQSVDGLGSSGFLWPGLRLVAGSIFCVGNEIHGIQYRSFHVFHSDGIHQYRPGDWFGLGWFSLQEVRFSANLPDFWSDHVDDHPLLPNDIQEEGSIKERVVYPSIQSYCSVQKCLGLV
jgi:hypothetical protein